MKMPPILPYGVPINQILETGDAELQGAMAKLSGFMMERVRAAGGEPDADWKAAHDKLQIAGG